MGNRSDYFNHKTILRCTSYRGTDELYIEQILPSELESPYGTGQPLSIRSGIVEPYVTAIDNETYPDGFRVIVEDGYGIVTGIQHELNGVVVQFHPDKLMEVDPEGALAYEFYLGLSEEDRERCNLLYQSLYDSSVKSAETKEWYHNKGIELVEHKKREKEVER